MEWLASHKSTVSYQSLINPLKSQAIKQSLKFLLQSAFKMSSFHIFLVLKAYDVLFATVICPWISAHKASEHMKKREAGRAVVLKKFKEISRHSPKKDFKKIMAEMWKARSQAK